MAILKIARMGHPVLLPRAEEVADPTAPEIQQLVADMIETMEDARGRGLAANQVHVAKRVVVFHPPVDRPAADADDEDEAEAEDEDEAEAEDDDEAEDEAEADDEDEETEGEVDLELPTGVPVLTPDAGKIRFAEDIMDEFRGGGTRRKGRRSAGSGARGARRGGR